MEINTLLIIGLGISLGFFAQTLIGFAATLIALPILLSVSTLQESIALLSIFLLLFSVILIYQNRKLIDKKIVMEMAIGGSIGLIVGIQALKIGNPDLLKKLLGVFIILYVAHSLVKKREIKLFNKLGFVFSFLGGFFSGLYSSGGPLFITYIHNKVKKMEVARATLIGTLGVTNILRVPLLIQADILNGKIFLQSLGTLPFFLISIYVGNRFYKSVNEKTVKQIFFVLLFATGISLVIR